MKLQNHFQKLFGLLLVMSLLLSIVPTATADGGYITVGTFPVPDFTGTPLRGKAPLTVQFTDNSYGDPTNMTYLWNFGDGNTSTSQNPSHTYTREGNFTVTLTLKNNYGTNSTTKTNYVYVGAGPIANFTANQTSGNSALSVKFTDQSTGDRPLTYLWDFGDGNTSTQQHPTHNFSRVGTYNVSLTVTNAFGTDTMVKNAYINIGVRANIFFTANSSCGSPNTVNFTTHGTVTEPATYLWNFGDGQTSTTRSPTHTYANTGRYNVTLTVTDQYSTVNYTLSNLVINNVLKADFTARNNMGGAPLTVQFSDASTGAAPMTYLWNFGDGTTSTAQNPSHTYRYPGSYNVALTVVSACGVDSVIKEGIVSVGNSPVAEFVGTPTAGKAPLNVQFTDQSQGTNLTYLWDFGDGSTSTTRNPAHTYEKAGTYTVKLTVSNAYGNHTATKTSYIVVGDAPVANFRGDVLEGIAPHPVQFTDLSTGNPTEWKWDFGDGQTSTQQHPKHTYQRSGYYNVTLTVKNAYGESTLLRQADGQMIYLNTSAPPVTPDPEPEPPEPEPPEEPGTTKPAIPGFEFLFAISAIAGLVVVRAFKRK